MSVLVEKVSSVKRKLTIVVPSEKIQQAYSHEIDAIAKKAKNLKGFRPGKAPMSYIQKHFGAEAQQQALSRVIQDSLFTALQEEKINPINTPEVEPKLNSMDQSFEFTASFEVLPDIEKIVFSAKPIEKITVDVTSQDVDAVIEKLRKQYGKWDEVQRAAAEGDRVVVDFTTHYEGQANSDEVTKGYPVELGAGTMIPGFEAGLLGATAGEERVLNLTFPTDMTDEKRAGKPVTIRATVKQVLSANLPVIDAEFVKKLGVASGQLDELQAQIKESLGKESERVVKDKLKEQIFNQLLEQNSFEVPPSLVAKEAVHIHDEIYAHRDHDHHQHSEGELKQYEEAATKRVCIGLIMNHYIQQEKLKVDSQRVSARIQEIAAIYEKPEEIVKWLSQGKQLQDIESQVLEDQIIDKLLEGAPITEKKMNFSELKGMKI